MMNAFINFLEFVLNTFYRDRLYPRFYMLETVARVPYFAFLSVLHLYETMGWWRKADWLKVHFAEGWNELHYLLVAEAMGGSQYGINRVVAHSGALMYDWFLVIVYMVSPRSACYFTQLVEEHTYHTYDEFLKAHEMELKTQPAPQIAINYYHEDDRYLFDEFQTAHIPMERRPKIENLYDVYVAIRDDEAEHVKTMVACQRSDAQLPFKSPHSSDAKALSEETMQAIAATTSEVLETTDREPATLC